jgi:hypothetical protein
VWFGFRGSLGKLSGVAQTFTVGGYINDSVTPALLLICSGHGDITSVAGQASVDRVRPMFLYQPVVTRQSVVGR